MPKKKIPITPQLLYRTTTRGFMPRVNVKGDILKCGRCGKNEIVHIEDGPARELAITGLLSIICNPCANTHSAI